MGTFSEMIANVCPNGVVYKQLSDVLKIKNGSDYKKYGYGDYPVYGSGGVMTYIDHYVYDKPSVLIPRKGSIDKLYYVETPFWNVDTVFYTEIDTNQVLPKYVYYCLAKEHLERLNTAGGVPSLTQKVLNKVKIPVPPLEIQDEIIRILDDFSSITNDLTTTLNEEAVGRKKQYDYYGNQLFEKISDDVNETTVGEVITSLKTGLNPRKNFTLNEQGACFPYITGKDIYDNKINVSEKTDLITPKALELINKRARLEKGLLLFASTGTGTVGRMAIIEDYNNDWGMSETLYGIKVDDSVILPHYLMFYLYSVAARNQFEPKITKGSVPHLKVKDLLDVKIPVPSIEEQQRIVDVLSRFDKLGNGMIEDLSSEIDARQKQYEYYRNKLLTFKEAV